MVIQYRSLETAWQQVPPDRPPLTPPCRPLYSTQSSSSEVTKTHGSMILLPKAAATFSFDWTIGILIYC